MSQQNTENPILDLVKTSSIRFAEWVENNYTKVVDPDDRKIYAWVNHKENTIYINGSDYHFKRLIEEHGKTIDKLWDEFVEYEKQRIENKDADKAIEILNR